MTDTPSPSVVPTALRSFFGVVVSRRTWLRTLWLALAFPLGLAAFVFLAVGLSLGVGLSILLIGPVLLVAVLLVARAMAVAEQRMATALLGAEMPQSPWLAKGDKPGFWSSIRANLVDGFTWRGLVYLALRLPIGLVAFTVLVTLGAFVGALLSLPFLETAASVQFGNWSPTAPWQLFAGAFAGVMLVPVMFHAFNGMGWLAGKFAAWLIRGARVQAPAPRPTEAAAA